MKSCTLSSFTILLQVWIIAGQSDVQETPAVPDCLCVPYYQCKNGTINDDGGGLISPRKLEPPISEKTESGVDETPVRCGEFRVCCNLPSKKSHYVHKCGIRKIRLDLRVAAKSSATTFGEWPWQGTLLLRGEDSTDSFQCAGVLIDKRHALTVAHCVTKFRSNKPPSLFFRLGLWDAHDEENLSPLQDMSVSRIKIHSRFNNETLVNDIAVLKFSRPVEFASHVDTICLPRADENHDGETCVVTGWGKSAWVGSSYSRYLKKSEVPVLNHTYCEAQLRRTRLGSHFKLNKNFLCAGGKEKEDACKGDGGGPLACQRSDGTYSLMGLVSWGIGCGEADTPGVYVNVKHYLNWISSVTKKKIEHYWP